MIYQNIIETIGNTPLVYLNKIKEKYHLKANILAKIEKNNPGGSIKDRVALKIITEAEKNHQINKDTVIMEATSGNTGIGIAMVCCYKGYKAIIVMPDNASLERIKILESFNAKVILTDRKKGMQGSIDELEQLKIAFPNHFICDQFNNYNSVLAHYESTAKELCADLGDNINIVVVGIGTGGTIMGLSKYLKEKNKNIKIIGVEPYEAAVINKIPFGENKIPGIGAKFIPSILDLNQIDEVKPIKSSDAIYFSNEVGLVEGILAGISSGANLKAAIEEAKKEENINKNIVVIFPDSKERYLSNV